MVDCVNYSHSFTNQNMVHKYIAISNSRQTHPILVNNIESISSNKLVKNNKNSKTDKVKNSIEYTTVGIVSALAGCLHGIYKKVNKEKVSTIDDASNFYNKFINKSKPKEVIQIADLVDTGSNGAISVISGFSTEKGPALAQKVLIDNKVNLEDSFKNNNEWIIKLQKGLMQLGFDPKHDKIVDFVLRHDLDKLNAKLKEITGFDFHIEFESHKGRHIGHHARYAYVICKEPPKKPAGPINRGLDCPQKVLKSEYAFFKKIFNPYDEKFFSLIEKIPSGKKFTDFMRKTNSPIKHSLFFRNKYYDSTSMLKGAGFVLLVSLSLFSSLKCIIGKSNQNKK